MAYSTANLAGEPVVGTDGRHLKVSWASSDPAGTIFQVYLDHALAWWGEARSVLLPLPREAVQVDVGAVDAGEGAVDFAASLPAGHPTRALLTWVGETAIHAEFRVFGSAVPGGAVDFATVLATIPATVAGADLSGFGLGGFGMGGFGLSASDYSWKSPPLANGDWTFAVVPHDAAGNGVGSPTTTTVAIAGRPNPPAPDASGARLTISFNAGTGVPTLHWLAAPA